jgi:hypothetical protein
MEKPSDVKTVEINSPMRLPAGNCRAPGQRLTKATTPWMFPAKGFGGVDCG